MPEKVLKLGVLGGSFNPPHNDHIRIAEYIKKKLNIDKFVIVPNAQPPHKNTCHVDFVHRKKMLELLIGNLQDIEISDIESDPKEPHFTIDLIDKLKNKFEKYSIYFCMGMDSLIYLDEWREGLNITDKCNIVVIGRKGYSIDEARPLVKNYLKQHAVFEDDVSFENKLSSTKGYCFLLKECFNDVSSSKIRAEFEAFYKEKELNGNLAVDLNKFPYTKEFLNKETIEYITGNSLYKKRDS